MHRVRVQYAVASAIVSCAARYDDGAVAWMDHGALPPSDEQRVRAAQAQVAAAQGVRAHLPAAMCRRMCGRT